MLIYSSEFCKAWNCIIQNNQVLPEWKFFQYNLFILQKKTLPIQLKASTKKKIVIYKGNSSYSVSQDCFSAFILLEKFRNTIQKKKQLYSEKLDDKKNLTDNERMQYELSCWLTPINKELDKDLLFLLPRTTEQNLESRNIPFSQIIDLDSFSFFQLYMKIKEIEKILPLEEEIEKLTCFLNTLSNEDVALRIIYKIIYDLSQGVKEFEKHLGFNENDLVNFFNQNKSKNDSYLENPHFFTTQCLEGKENSVDKIKKIVLASKHLPKSNPKEKQEFQELLYRKFFSNINKVKNKYSRLFECEDPYFTNNYKEFIVEKKKNNSFPIRALLCYCCALICIFIPIRKYIIKNSV